MRAIACNLSSLMPALHDSPDPQDLVQAVRDMLATEVLDLLNGPPRFHVRVAMNVLDIVQRQLASAPHDETAHRARLASLGFEEDTELADAIRSGELDDRYQELATLIRQDVWDKVAVVNPRYRLPYTSPETAREITTE